jgi:hypothetical protein
LAEGNLIPEPQIENKSSMSDSSESHGLETAVEDSLPETTDRSDDEKNGSGKEKNFMRFPDGFPLHLRRTMFELCLIPK